MYNMTHYIPSVLEIKSAECIPEILPYNYTISSYPPLPFTEKHKV